VTVAPFVVLETERLVLRRLVPDDLPALHALYRDPVVRRFFPDGTRTLEETREELEWFLGGHPRHTELGLWATVERATGAFLGRCGLLPWTIDGALEVELAYLIDPARWGEGFATEAARAIVRHAHETLGLGRLIGLIDPENAASVRVAEKVGMRFDRHHVDAYGPCALYARSRHDPIGSAAVPDDSSASS
jgi:ribosomal-protein-alanine N-acetyltransferase